MIWLNMHPKSIYDGNFVMEGTDLVIHSLDKVNLDCRNATEYVEKG